VIFPATLQSLGKSAFARSRIQSAILTDAALRTLGSAAFETCQNLTNATLPKVLERVSERVFRNAGLQSIQIPEGVLTLEKESFAGVRLRSVTLPNSLTNIGFAAFAVCTILTEIHFPSSLLNIDRFAFSECYALTNATFSEGLSQIETDAFAATSLSRVDLPSSLKYISPTAFACPNLTNINVATENPIYKTVAGVLFHIARNELVTFPAANAETYSVPDGTTAIGEHAFVSCYQLKQIQLPSSVTEIQEGAFWHCTSLTHIRLPDKLTRLNADVFSGCVSLESVTFPKHLAFIDETAFWNCILLKSLYFLGDAPSLGDSTSLLFFGPRAKLFYLPEAAGWGPFLGGAETILWDASFKTGSELRLADDGFTFSIQTSREVRVVVEVSHNLTEWFPLSTNSVSIGAQTFNDLLVGTNPQRFYRVRTE
jgi:hypothetical protein